MAAPATQAIGTKYGVKGNMWAAGHHTGVDYLCPTGTPLKAPVDGKILHAGSNSSTGWGAAYGIHVIGESVIAGKTYRWMTAHMSSVSVKAGQTVKLGATLGKSGATGNVTGPHCHFEVRIANFAYGNDVNPTVATNVKASSSSAKPPVAVWGKPETFVLGATGADVTHLGERLVIWAEALKLPAPYKAGPGSPFSATDVAAVKGFQKAQGWSGADADGYPGVETFKRLAADPKPPTEPEPPVTKTATLHGLHWNIAGSDIHNGYGARNATRGPDVGDRALEIGFDVFLTCEAGQTNLRAGVNTVLGQHKPWYSHAKGIWISDDVKLLDARKAYADNLYNYLKTVKYGAGIFGEIEGKKFGILEIHTDYRKPAKQAAQVKSLFAKFRKDCDALGIKHVNQLVVGDLNWDGTSGDDPFKALASYNFEEKGSHTAKTFFTGKHLDGVLAHEEAEVTVKVRDRVDLSDHFPVEFEIKLK